MKGECEMEELKIINLGSGSSGNCYLLGKGDEYIMVECGLPFKTIVSKLADYDIQLDQIKALCVSHSHKDHALSLADFELLGVKTYAPWKEGANAPEKATLTDWIKVRSFLVSHDVPCYAFIFLTKDKESLLFMTDTRYIESDYFKYKYNYIMIECNHIRKQLEAIMDKALLEGNQAKVFKFKRQASFHMGLFSVKKTLKAMDLSETKGIILLHLSKECCNDDLVKKEIAACFGKPTFVAYRNGGLN